MKFTNQNKLVRGVQAAIAVVRGSPPMSIAVLCGCLMLAQLVTAQVYNPIDTVAGPGRPAPFGDGGPAIAATLTFPQHVAVDSLGNVYFSDRSNHRVRRIDVGSGIVSTVAGTGEQGFSGDDGPATSASVNWPEGVAVDSLGNLYISDYGNHRVRRVDATTGTISTVAGTGEQGSSGDDGPATSARISYPFGLAVDSLGNLYIQTGDQVRRVDAESGTITAFAGTGERGFSGDGGPATSALMSLPRAFAADSLGNLYIADYGNRRVRRIDAVSGVISTVVGTGHGGFSGDGGPATSATMSRPAGVAVDGLGNLYIADIWNYRVRVVDSSGIIRTVAGSSTAPRFAGDGGPAAYSELSSVAGVAVDDLGNLYIADLGNHRIRRVATAREHDPIDTVAGRGRTAPFGDGGPALDATLTNPRNVAVDSLGNLYFSEPYNNRVRRIGVGSGVISTVAGTGEQGFSGDGGPATSATMRRPTYVAVDGLGNLYISDQANHRVRRVDATTGTISTVAGTGVTGSTGDGGPATSAKFGNPFGLAVDSLGNLYIAQYYSNRVRRVDAASGIITTVAGNGRPGISGDGGPASSARINRPAGLAVDSLGNLYIADWGNRRVRRVDAASGTISTVAGTGERGILGDGGPATSAATRPFDLAVDAVSNVYIAEHDYYRVRRVDAASGTISTVAGSSTAPRFAGDGGPAAFSELSSVTGVTVDDLGNLYIADEGNHRIRRVRLTQ